MGAIGTLYQDLRFSVRQLTNSPGFTLTAVLSLALGIGATAAVFSVIYAALISPFPYRDVDRIVRLNVRAKAGNIWNVGLNGAQVRQLQEVDAIQDVLVMDFHPMALTGHDVPLNVNVVALISTGFRDLGMKTALGRGLVPSDGPDRQTPKPVAVLSYKFWRDQFLSDPYILGKTVALDRKPYTIVGVAAPRFTWYSADVYIPLDLAEDSAFGFIANVRLKPGITHAAANAQIEPLIKQFAKETPRRFPEHFKVQVEGLNEWVIRGMSGTLYLLFGAVALLLAIGCANVSILLLARGAARRHELAVRAALGAPRRRIIRQLLTESLLLSAIGVVLGVWLSYGILAGVRLLLPRYAFAPEVAIAINIPVLFFAAAVALATGVISGLWPALQLSRAQMTAMIQSGARRVAGSVHGRRSHNALIAGQIALTLLLLAGAGSAMEGFLRLVHTPLGYDPHHVLSLALPIHYNSYNTWAARAEYIEQLRAKVAETPGILMTAIATNGAPPRNGMHTKFEMLGQPAMEERRANVILVGAAYFRLLHIPLLSGRIWSDAETRTRAHVAVINRTLARRYFPKGDAIGHSLKVPGFDDHPPEILSAPHIADSWLQIVGIVGDAKNDGLGKPVAPAIFVPYTLTMQQWIQILVHSQPPPLSLLHAMRARLAAVDPEQQTFNITEDLETIVSSEPEYQQEHLAAWIFAIFAVLALALAAIGLYSVVSYTVAQRTGEFGIRMALGAQPVRILRAVFRSTLASLAAGILAGLALSFALRRGDPLILLAAVLLLSAVCALASLIPGWRAGQADPMDALRCP